MAICHPTDVVTGKAGYTPSRHQNYFIGALFILNGALGIGSVVRGRVGSR